MDKIKIKNANVNNLKNVSLEIPLRKLVAVVGKSGSGKSSLVCNVLYEASQGHEVEAVISKLPKTYLIRQKVKPVEGKSLGETNFYLLNKILREIKRGDLLIVDEPCAGMADVDRNKIVNLLKRAVKDGVSIIMVEHSRDVIVNADYVIEFGPESGAKGGKVIFQGSIEEFRKSKTITSEYVFSNKASLVGYQRNPNDKAKVMQNKKLKIKGITKYNLKNFDLEFPLSGLVCVSGPMGVGKSTLLSVVYGALFKGKDAWKLKEGFRSIEGKTNIRRSYLVDQSPLNSISTSTPATYLGVWKNIKAKKNVDDVSKMTVDQAVNLFSESPLIVRKLGFLQEVGLGYLTLGQKSGTLSGGEAQRVRLAKILSKKLGDRCVYILDVPSRRLHLSNIPVLIKVFRKIIDKNNTVLIAENREELIDNCDYVINLTK